MHFEIVRRDVPNGPADLPDDLHPVLARIYRARNITSSRELDTSLQGLLPADQLAGLERAVDLLAEAIAHDWKILIVGDFDADGATSTALAIRALRSLGARHVDYLVPNRFEYGYGLTPEIVAVAERDKHPDLIITVDNGISSVEGVRAARGHGIRVLVTDHHLAGAELPAADAILNPNQPGDAFPSKALAGVGVVFYLLSALRTRLRASDWFATRGIAEPNLAQFLDLVALGTVADVVPLDANNRILVGQGLARIRHGACCPGIRALILVAKRQCERVVAADLGFALGPRLNAAGRLEDMSLGIECLLADDPDVAVQLATRLDELNAQRREIEQDMKEQALARLAKLDLNEESLPVGLCLYDPEWHQGVIGILASRVKDRYHRPVIAFAPAGDGLIKGSARSVPGLHIRDALDAVAARHPELLEKFGGHAMAAGMSIREADFPAFAAAFDAEVARHLDEAELRGRIHSDGGLAARDIHLELAELLRNAGPWGQGFPEPVFDGEFELVNRRIVGERHLKLVLKVPDGARTVDAIAFNHVDDHWPEGVARVRAAYRLDVNDYNGSRRVQLCIEYLEPLTESALVATP